MSNPNCLDPITQRRRTFWATQPSACGTDFDGCGNPCGLPGLTFIEQTNGRTIATTEWVRGLMLNILMTDQRVANSICGVNPAAVKGHWSDNYRSDGLQAGTQLRQANFKGLGINESVALINAYVTASARKLIRMGVAQDVKATTQYVGNNSVRCEIELFSGGGAPMGNVAIVGNRSNSTWMWA